MLGVYLRKRIRGGKIISQGAIQEFSVEGKARLDKKGTQRSAGQDEHQSEAKRYGGREGGEDRIETRNDG